MEQEVMDRADEYAEFAHWLILWSKRALNEGRFAEFARFLQIAFTAAEAADRAG